MVKPLHTLLAFGFSLLLVACEEAPSLDDKDLKHETTNEDHARFSGLRPGKGKRRDQGDIEAAMLVEAPETGVDLGWGWNTFHAEPIPTICVKFARGDKFKAQTTTLNFKEINDSFELMEAMDISAEVSVKTVAYKAKGKAKFAKDVNVSGFSSTFVFEAEVQNDAVYAAPTTKSLRGKAETATATEDEGAVRLTPEAAKLARTDIELFKDVCGNGYVSATMGGAKLTAVVDIETSSRSEREKMKAEVSGSGWGVKVKAAMGSEEGSETASFKREISFYQTGGRDQDLPTDEKKIMERVNDLAKQASEAEKLFQIVVMPYELLENWPRGEELTGEEAEFTELAAIWGAYNTLYDEIQEAMDEPDDFVVPVASCAAEGGCAVRFKEVVKENETYRILEDLQDEVLAALDWLELDAEGCTEAEESCDFNAGRYRSPYAIRVRLPIPKAVLYDDLKMVDLAQKTCSSVISPVKTELENLESIEECISLTEEVHKEAIALLSSGDKAAKDVIDSLKSAADAAKENCDKWSSEPDETATDGCSEAVDQAARSAAEFQSTCVELRDAEACGTPTEQQLRHFIDTQIHEMAKSRCRFGSLTPGCLSNAAIRAWGARTGYRTNTYESAEKLNEEKNQLSGLLLVCDGDSGAECGDPGAEDGLVLWYAWPSE